MPDFGDILDVLMLRDYNTRLVVLCTILLGSACGLIGGFLLLRKRSLIGDTLSHATLPGIGLAFIVGGWFVGDGKSLPILMAGATITGILGCQTVLWIRNHSRVRDDTAMGIVLSVFFGGGIVLLSMIQTMPEGSAAGLESFIYGKTASIVWSDFYILRFVAFAVIVPSLLLFKEFRLICFDENFAASQGWPVKWLDLFLLFLATVVTVAGLQVVGLVLIIAFLITPAATARFWTNRLDSMLLLSALIGAGSGWIGAGLSAFFPRLPTGAVIVLVATGCFITSLFLGTERGVWLRYRQQSKLKHRLGRQHLLRALYEILEASGSQGTVQIQPVPFRQIRGRRTWSDSELRHYIRHARHDGLIETSIKEDFLLLTNLGLAEAAQVTRNHRLWELYLIEYANMAISRVDRDADRVEHVLGDRMVAQLEEKLNARGNATSQVPESPHLIVPGD